MRILVLALTVAAMAAAAVCIWQARQDRSPDRGVAVTGPVEPAAGDLRSEMAALRSEVESLRMRQNAAPVPREPRAADPEPRRAARPARDLSEVVHSLDDRIARDGADRSWGRPLEAAIAEALRADSLHGSSLVRMTCGSTVCRAEIAHDGAESQDAFMRQLASGRLAGFGDGEGFAQKANDSALSRSVVYLARPGHPI